MISIIIPTYNAERYIKKLLDSVTRQTISDFEILVIDSSSKDRTVPIAKKFNVDVTVIPQSEFDHGGTRTFAAKKAKGDILVFLTQDIEFASDDAIALLVQYLQSNEQMAAVYGRQLPRKDANLFGACLRHYNYPAQSKIKSLRDAKQLGIKAAFLSDSFAAYKRVALEEIGYFKNGLIFGEDMHAGARFLLSDKLIGYCAEAKVYHSHNYSICEEFRRSFDIGVFHYSEPWLLDKFGSAEGAGKDYVLTELKYLIKHKSYHNIVMFFFKNAVKVLGYKLGRKSNILPKLIAGRLGLNRTWWRNK